MKTIWKYELKPGKNQIELPLHYIPLDVQVQVEKPILWCLVETENDKVMPTFYIFCTGEPINNELNLKYIGTFQLDWMVFHLFEEIL